MSYTKVPVAPFRTMIVDFLRERGYQDGEGEYTLREAADDLGLGYRMLFRVLNDPQENIEFSTADIIVTKTVGPMAWHTDPVLNGIYGRVDLRKMDLLDPVDADFPQAWARDRFVTAYREAGCSFREAAQLLGLDYTSVKLRAKRYGLASAA